MDGRILGLKLQIFGRRVEERLVFFWIREMIMQMNVGLVLGVREISVKQFIQERKLNAWG